MCNIVDMDIVWMRYAITLASYANVFGEVSVGAVLIKNSKIVGYGWNSVIANNDPSAHAEIIALRMGGKILGNYRLVNTILYVTLEPCIMCIGAIVHARIYRLVYGAKNKKIEGITSYINNCMLSYPMINHHIYITAGILEKICVEQINNFFKYRRQSCV